MRIKTMSTYSSFLQRYYIEIVSILDSERKNARVYLYLGLTFWHDFPNKTKLSTGKSITIYKNLIESKTTKAQLKYFEIMSGRSSTVSKGCY